MNHPGRGIRLRFESRAMTLAKDPDYADENQDCFRVDESRGVAAVADGVSSAIFSGLWARILVEAAVDGLPDPEDREAFAPWLAQRREAWSGKIDVSRLAWFQKPKLREGAFSTLLCVRLVAAEEDLPADASAWRLRGVAIGDTCLFLVRDGQLQRKFPIQKAIDLEADPMVLGSIDLCRDHLVRACRMDEPCQAGDLILLCTDAWAEWALRSEELGNPPAWSNYWDISSADWEAEIKALRESRTIRFDDTTLVMLRISAEPSAVEPSEALPIESSLPSPTTAQIDENAAEISAEIAKEISSVTSPPPAPWRHKMEKTSEEIGRQLSKGAKWAMRQVKSAGRTARRTTKKYLGRKRPDDPC